MNTQRTLIIGLDGATFDLIEPWAQGGYLPTLARLMAQGVHGPLRAWPNMNSAAAWTSMVTGYNPGQHGIYDFGYATPQRGHAWHPTTAAERRREPFWCLLSAAGQRVGVINVPISYPADPVDGFMLSGTDTPEVGSPGFAHPPGLRDELRCQGIAYVIDIGHLGVLRSRNPHQLPQPVQQIVDARARAILHLMRTRPWDVLMAVFVATDRVQHYFWPDEPSSLEGADWAPIRSLHQQLDSFLREALAFIDANTTVLVVSDHGFGPRRPAKDLLNDLFAQLGLLCYRQVGSPLLKHLLLYGREVIPFALQDPLARVFAGLHRRALKEQRLSGIEWSQTQVFSVHLDRVVLNLQGREPEGTVSPDDYHPFRERICDILLNLSDPATGRRVFRAVHRREEVYHGPYLEQAPDLVLEWDDEVVRDGLCYSADGEPIIVQPPTKIRSSERWWGEHDPVGIFVACGPHIRQGATVGNATLYDIAPTILYLQGHPIPRDMDGKVLTEVFAEEYLRRNPIQWQKPTNVEVQTGAVVLDEKEARKIEERLRDLGYIE